MAKYKSTTTPPNTFVRKKEAESVKKTQPQMRSMVSQNRVEPDSSKAVVQTPALSDTTDPPALKQRPSDGQSEPISFRQQIRPSDTGSEDDKIGVPSYGIDVNKADNTHKDLNFTRISRQSRPVTQPVSLSDNDIQEAQEYSHPKEVSTEPVSLEEESKTVSSRANTDKYRENID